MENFAEHFKRARLAAGITQADMSKLMEIPLRTVESWEVGKRTPPPYVQRFILNELESIARERGAVSAESNN